MSSETFEIRQSMLERLIIALGRWRTPHSVAGHLVVTLPSGRSIEIGKASQGNSAELRLASYKPVWASIRRASVGFCEAYIDGHWDSPDPGKVFSFYLKNYPTLDRAAKPFFFRSLINRAWHLMRDNSRAGSKRNIEAHYDLGNDFYRLWLDETMTYSSAWFGSGARTLEAAQAAKYQLVVDALGLEARHEFLEIGFGWGGLVEKAAGLGAKITGVTLSQQQLAYARKRLGDGADLRLQDYRDTTGTFDRIAAIEMVEAVGEAHWPRFFRTLADRLKPGGTAVLQVITIDPALFPAYRSSTDFIQRHIFPGGMLPTVEILRRQAEAAGLVFEPMLQFGQDYARTLALWRERFEATWPKISVLGFDDRFRRKWRLYLAYCEAGFRERTVDVGLYRFVKPP